MADWFYGDNGQRIGPMDESVLRAAIQAGQVRPDTPVWRQGMADWQPLAQVAELALPYAGPAVPGYGGPVYAPTYYQQAPTSGLAIASLVCGIVGLVTCMFIPGIPAVICGHMALSQISNSNPRISGRGMAIAGLVMGYLQAATILSFVVMFLFGVFGSFRP